MDVYGVEIIFDQDVPVARYLSTEDNLSPRLTHELVDQIIAQIDPSAIDKESLSFGVGAAPNLATRTLQLISEALHDQCHDTRSSEQSSDTSRSATP